MKTVFECVSPQVMHALFRRFPRVEFVPIIHGYPTSVRRARAFANALMAEGFLVHDAAPRMLVAPGSVDVERTWRRSGRLSHEQVPRMHRQSLATVREHVENVEAKAARAAAREAARVADEDPGMLGFVP